MAGGGVDGWPRELTSADVKLWFRTYGKDLPMLKAAMTKSPLHHVRDYQKLKASEPGEIMTCDAITPTFGHFNAKKDKGTAPDDEQIKSGIVPSIDGGFTSYVRCMDPYTGVRVGKARKDKKRPQDVVEYFVALWMSTWKNRLTSLVTDREFTHPKVAALFDHLVPGGRIRTAPPGEHFRGLQTIEGNHRWLQDRAQANINRAIPLVDAGIMSERQMRSLWLEAIRLAEFVDLGSPCWHDPRMTKYKALHKRAFNFSAYPALPFMTPLMCRMTEIDATGRGEPVYYLNPEMTAVGSIKAWCPRTAKTRIVYSMFPQLNMDQLKDVNFQVTYIVKCYLRRSLRIWKILRPIAKKSSGLTEQHQTIPSWQMKSRKRRIR